jgi:serine/threonine-protein kinase
VTRLHLEEGTLMAGNPQVLGLLEEMLDSGRTPEEVCRDCPELLPEVRERWQNFRRIDAQIEALLPGLRTAPIAGPVTPDPPRLNLPQVPGYEVEAILGRGGMGVVYKVRQHALDRSVALKMLLAGPFAGSRELGRFRRETAALACLRHANIVPVYDAGDVEGRPYFIMEFVEGGSLAQKLSGTPQPARQAAVLLATLAEAVQVAHQAGILHRDLKPANILLTADGTPKIADFGLARRLEGGGELTESGVPMGTPSYMAPEQARGQTTIGPGADVYALGAILYELLTGRPPFHGGTAAATMHQVINHDPVPPSRLNFKVPRDLETICLKCLQKDPAKRYPTAADLAADLGRFLRHEPIRARPTGRMELCWRWVRRHPAAAGLLAAMLLLMLVGGVGAGLLYRHWAADRDRRAQTDQEVREVLERSRGQLAEAWQTQDLTQLTAALAEGNRALDIARSGEASAAVRQEAENFRTDAGGRLQRAKKNRALLEAVLDVSAPQETRQDTRDETGQLMVLNQLSTEEQYAAAFRRWGLDMDRTAEADVVERLRAEPDGMVQELIAALDSWMMERRGQRTNRKRELPEAPWRHLYRIADQLDHSDRRRRLRALLVHGLPPRPEWVAGVVGVGSPWLALWEQAHGNRWRYLLEARREIDLRKEPALTVVLLAQAFAAVGDTAAAEQVLRHGATVQPGQVVLLDALGKLLESQGPSRLEEAIGYYRTARGQRHHLGISLSKALLSAGRPAEVEQVMQELVLLQPDNPAFYFYLGSAAYHQKKYGEAQTYYRKAIDLYPDFAKAYCNLGSTLNAEQKHREAEGAFRKALDLKPDFAEAYGNLGSALIDQQKYVEAEAVLLQAIDLKPDLAFAYNNLGGALIRQERYGAAERALRRAIDLKPDCVEAYANLCNALSTMGKHWEAQAAVQKALDIDPSCAIAYYNLGNLRIRQQKWGEAEAAFRKAMDLNPALNEACYSLGMALMRQARFDEAAAPLQKAGDLLPATNPGRGLARQLQLQCQRYLTLEARLPALLRGTEKPANAAEQIECARLCQIKKLYAAAALFFAAAFAAEPKLADDVPQGVRYDAACAAALAGCASGKDGDKLDDKARARWRRQALDWLREDLTWWAKKLENGTAQARILARQRLQDSQNDPDLAGVRDSDGLARLPNEERAKWERFWSDVAALLYATGR